jgi:hypothetical protein
MVPATAMGARVSNTRLADPAYSGGIAGAADLSPPAVPCGPTACRKDIDWAAEVGAKLQQVARLRLGFRRAGMRRPFPPLPTEAKETANRAMWAGGGRGAVRRSCGGRPESAGAGATGDGGTGGEYCVNRAMVAELVRRAHPAAEYDFGNAWDAVAGATGRAGTLRRRASLRPAFWQPDNASPPRRYRHGG